MERKKKILVVDDEPDFLEIMRIRLEAHNYEVMTARAAKDALKKMKDFRPHAILLDIVMPGLDGLEMLRTIRRYNRNLPVFMITAFSNEDRFRLARKLKASGFIVKTGDLKREVDNINGLLNISHRYKGSLASSACKRKRK